MNWPSPLIRNQPSVASSPLTGNWTPPPPAAIVDKQFVEVIIAPSVSAEAAAAVADKKNVRLLACGEWSAQGPALDYKRVNGGLLVQDRDLGMITAADLKVVSKLQPTTSS